MIPRLYYWYMHPINDTRLQQLLIKRRQQQLTSEEQQLLDEWFTNIQSTDAAWYKSEADEKAQLNMLWQSIERKTAVIPMPVAKQSFRFRYWWAAAALTGVILLLVWMRPQQQQQQTVAQTTITQPKAVISMLTVTAKLGTVKTITLPDSSIVLLNSGATLQYPEQFNENVRNVTLVKGQAFFEVKQQLQPFTVQTGMVYTQVLGTSFEVNMKPQKSVSVALATGKVKVANNRQKVLAYLLPGKKLEYNNKTEKTIVSECELGTIASWRNREIKLEQASFAALSEAFQTVYGVQLKTSDSLVRKQSYTIVLRYHTNMQDMLQVLSAIHNNQYNTHNNTAVITRKKP